MKEGHSDPSLRHETSSPSGPSLPAQLGEELGLSYGAREVEEQERLWQEIQERRQGELRWRQQEQANSKAAEEQQRILDTIRREQEERRREEELSMAAILQLTSREDRLPQVEGGLSAPREELVQREVAEEWMVPEVWEEVKKRAPRREELAPRPEVRRGSSVPPRMAAPPDSTAWPAPPRLAAPRSGAGRAEGPRSGRPLGGLGSCLFPGGGGVGQGRQGQERQGQERQGQERQGQEGKGRRALREGGRGVNPRQDGQRRVADKVNFLY